MTVRAKGLGVELSRSESKSGRVLERRRPERVDSLIDDVEFDRRTMRHFCELSGLPVPSTGVFVPLLVQESGDRRHFDSRQSRH